jgi:hypothetical protein
VIEGLGDSVMHRASREDVAAAIGGRACHRFWFAHAEEMGSSDVAAAARAGLLILPSINTFHYAPHAHLGLAAADIGRLDAAGVDGFQIDDVYRDFVVARASGRDASATER